MPCSSDYGPSIHTEYVEKEHDGKMAARLCAVLTTLEARGWLHQTLDNIDYKEAGITRKSLQNWWNEHKQRDVERRLREQEEARRMRVKRNALAKLTDAEKKALGVR